MGTPTYLVVAEDADVLLVDVLNVVPQVVAEDAEKTVPLEGVNLL